MRFRPASVRVRLTLWYTMVLAGIVVALFGAVYLFVRASLVRQLDSEAGAEFLAISQAVAEEPNEIAEMATEMSGRAFRLAGEGVGPYESPAFKAAGLPAIEPGEPAAGQTLTAADGRRFRVRSGPAGHGLLLTVAVPEEPVRGALRTLLVIFVLALPAGLGLAALGGSLMAGRLLRPVAVMAARAEEISAESLSSRLPIEDPSDEFGRLATVFNRMLARLEESFDRLRRFTADASHELRTPLTVIQSVGEVALQEDLDTAAYRDRIGSMLEELNRLSRLVDSLLTLTRADAAAAAVRRTEIDAVRLAARAVEDMRPLAEEKGQDLTLSGGEPVTVQADEGTLRLALVNVLDNAVKYAPAGGTIDVGVRAGNGQVLIEVADNGPGVPAAHVGRIFERFYRVDQSRSGESGGTGLGLAIAKWAVEVNGGRIEYAARDGGGSLFRLVLPVARV
jgi:heavy metal sensor kinase